jgi:hypothetical protein
MAFEAQQAAARQHQQLLDQLQLRQAPPTPYEQFQMNRATQGDQQASVQQSLANRMQAMQGVAAGHLKSVPQGTPGAVQIPSATEGEPDMYVLPVTPTTYTIPANSAWGKGLGLQQDMTNVGERDYLDYGTQYADRQATLAAAQAKTVSDHIKT